MKKLILFYVVLFSLLGGWFYYLFSYNHQAAYSDCSYKWNLTLKDNKAVPKWDSTPVPPLDILEICAKVFQEDRRLEHEKRFESISNLRKYSK